MSELKLIKGGLEPVGLTDKTEYVFCDASVTDTRLMGVLGLRIHWKKTAESQKDVYHFYYYDVEELGLDSFSVFELSGEEEILFATKACFGGLGAIMWPISEKEARYLVHLFRDKTLGKKQPLPDNIGLASFILDVPAPLSDTEKENLDRKMCTFVKTDQGIVNYYLMRVFGKDEEGAALLRAKDVPSECFEDVSLPGHASFLRNTVESFEDEDGKVSFLSESLVESSDDHYIVTSEIRLHNNRVISCRKRSSFKISIQEASMMISRQEYVTVYEIVSEMDDFDKAFAVFSVGATRTEHETGDMFMSFRPDNSHAERSDFRLSDDLAALYYVSDYGQFIVAANSLEDIVAQEKAIAESSLKDLVYPTTKYNFAQSVLYEFALSAETDFDYFVTSLE